MTLEQIAARVGNTPLLDVTPEGVPSTVYAKAEYCNMTGSIKDRAALSMIRDGLSRGALSPGRRILEATSGNTGIGLALMGRLLGYQTVLVMPPQVNRDRRDILESAGVEVVYSEAAHGSNGALLKALSLYKTDPEKWFWPNQYFNPANYKAHETTAREIYEDTRGMVTHFVAGAGTGGTVIGVSSALRGMVPALITVVAEPAEEMHGIEGTKHMDTEDVPILELEGRSLTGIYSENRGLLSGRMFVSTDDAYAGMNSLAERRILVGPSSGMNYAAACRLASENPGSVVVTVFPDSSDRYLTESPWAPGLSGMTLPYAISRDMWRQFEDTYPDEGCGLLFGRWNDQGRSVVQSFHKTTNVNTVRSHDRYEMNPKEILVLEKEAAARGEKLVGIAHSHPDHPPRPSQFDLDVAWEDLSYVIYSLVGGCVVSLKSWRLEEGSHGRGFLEELIRLTSLP